LLPKAHRLRRPRDFRRVQQLGETVRGPLLSLTVAPGVTSATRIGFVVSRKLGGAVCRNRVRRRLRAACSVRLADLAPAHDLVVVARSGAGSARYAEIDAAIEAALTEAGVLGRRDTQADGTCETPSSS